MQTGLEILGAGLVMLLTTSFALALEWLLLRGILALLVADLGARETQVQEPKVKGNVSGV